MPAPLFTSSQLSVPSTPSFLSWLGVSMGIPTAELHIKLRGNILHVLCETTEPLDQSAVLLKLVRALLDTDGDSLLKQHYPQVYQLYLYSRLVAQPTPAWTAPIYLNRLERHLAQLVLENQDEEDIKAAQSLLGDYTQGQADIWRSGEGGSGAIVLSNLSLARKGDPEAIAWYLSETLSALDVGVWVSIKAIPGTAHLHRAAITSDDAIPDLEAQPDLAEDQPSEESHIPRLWILCEATYSPDPSLIARPTAERLRQLQLTQFKDAVLLLQVRGESQPDWSLRIDLTPPEEMLREWGRWGDVDAIARVVTPALAAWHLAVEGELTNGTLHLICRPQSGDHGAQPGDELEPKDAILDAIATSLDALAPQGIHRAVVYGQRGPSTTAPDWIHYLDLPAAQHPALADTPEYLGQIGDLPAIAFLLTRRLNPNLDDRLATGGLRVQLLVRDKLLHVMVDSPVTPQRRLVVPDIKAYLLDLSPTGIEGMRIYGRRSGQSQPAWSYGQDFLTRSRIVPESVPEFTASDAYVNDLLVRPDGPVTHADVAEAEADGVGLWFEDLATQWRRMLVRSRLFVGQQPDDLLELGADPPLADNLKIAVVWAAVGVLVALQIDWLMGQVMSPPTNPAKAEVTASSGSDPANAPPGEDLSQVEWPTSGEAGTSDTVFGGDGFINSAGGEAAAATPPSTDLATSPSQPIVAIDDLVARAALPTFNSQLLDEKIALYYQRLEESGPPDVLIIGSSRALRGVDPVALRKELAPLGYDNISIFNFGINGATAQVVDLVIRRLLEPDQLPRLILWADGARAFNSGRVDVTYDAISVSPGYVDLMARRAETEAASGSLEDASGSGESTPATGLQSGATLPSSYAAMDEWMSNRLASISSVYPDRARLKSWIQDQIVSAVVPLPGVGSASEETLDAPMPEGSIIDFDGFLALSVRFNPATYYQDFARVTGPYDRDYENFRLEGQQSDAFASLLEFTQAKQIPVVFINTPLTDEYLDDYRQAAEAEFLQYMLRLSTTEAGFIFRDLGTLWPSRYDYFSDPSHLNRYGAYQVSNQLAQDPLIAWPKSSPKSP